MLIAYERCADILVESVKSAAEKTKNRVLQGWAFELSQIHLIRCAIEMEKRVVNAKGTVVLPTSTAKVTYNGQSVDGEVSGDTFVIECTKRNQGCFDIAFYVKDVLVTVQFTVSSKHSLKTAFIRLLKSALENKGKAVKSITHIAIVEDPKKAAAFNFDAERNGHESSGEVEFTVHLARSTKLIEQSQIHGTQSNNVELTIDDSAEEIHVYSERRSK